MSKELLEYKNVVGVCEFEKLIGADLKTMTAEEISECSTGEQSTTVLVKQKPSESELEDDEIIPKEFDGKVTDVLDVGGPIVDLSIQGQEVKYDPWHDEYSNRFGEWSTLAGGIEVQHERSAGVGTLGGIMIDNDGDLVGTSNEHVIAPLDVDPEVGDRILHPGSGKEIGELKEFSSREDDPDEDGNMFWDQASFLIYDDVDVSSTILGLGEIGEFEYEPKRLETYYASGRTTGVTPHNLFTKESTINVKVGEDDDGEDIIITFEDVHLYSRGTLGGDSGSWICDVSDNVAKPVAKLFAGSSIMTVGIPAENITDYHGEWKPPNLDVPPHAEDYEKGYDDAESECEKRVQNIREDHEEEVSALYDDIDELEEKIVELKDLHEEELEEAYQEAYQDGRESVSLVHVLVRMLNR